MQTSSPGQARLNFPASLLESPPSSTSSLLKTDCGSRKLRPTSKSTRQESSVTHCYTHEFQSEDKGSLSLSLEQRARFLPTAAGTTRKTLRMLFLLGISSPCPSRRITKISLRRRIADFHHLSPRGFHHHSPTPGFCF